MDHWTSVCLADGRMDISVRSVCLVDGPRIACFFLVDVSQPYAAGEPMYKLFVPGLFNVWLILFESVCDSHLWRRLNLNMVRDH